MVITSDKGLIYQIRTDKYFKELTKKKNRKLLLSIIYFPVHQMEKSFEQKVNIDTKKSMTKLIKKIKFSLLVQSTKDAFLRNIYYTFLTKSARLQVFNKLFSLKKLHTKRLRTLLNYFRLNILNYVCHLKKKFIKF